MSVHDVAGRALDGVRLVAERVSDISSAHPAPFVKAHRCSTYAWRKVPCYARRNVADVWPLTGMKSAPL
jgi:hypothetical protein